MYLYFYSFLRIDRIDGEENSVFDLAAITYISYIFSNLL